MSRPDNIETEWLECNGVKYIECEWSDDEATLTPENSPRELKKLADALNKALQTKPEGAKQEPPPQRKPNRRNRGSL